MKFTKAKQTNGPATKQDLVNLEKRLEKKMDKKFATKIDLEGLEGRFKDTVISFKDEILYEIKAMREELAIITGYKDQIENHETRIETVEKKLQIPSTV